MSQSRKVSDPVLFRVFCGEDFVAIYHGDRDVLYWDQAEWEEDPTVVLAIVNACRQAYEEPRKMHDFLVSKGILVAQEDALV